MKKLLISAMIAACLITTMAQAQTYNATGSVRQAASNDMGMYQLTLEAFRKSEYYLHNDSEQAANVRWAADQVILAKGLRALVSPTGQIIQYYGAGAGTKYAGQWFEIPESTQPKFSSGCQTLGPQGGGGCAGTDRQSIYFGVVNLKTPLYDTSTVALNIFNNSSNIQRAAYLSLADIAEKSFIVIRNKKMNRKTAVSYLINQIDASFSELVAGNFKQPVSIVMTSQMKGIPSENVGGNECVNKNNITVICTGAEGGFMIPRASQLVLNGFNEWTATFPDGLVIKNNHGAVDVSQNGRPWFSEAGIKGEKLSIAGSSEKGSSTSQKRGE